MAWQVIVQGIWCCHGNHILSSIFFKNLDCFFLMILFYFSTIIFTLIDKFDFLYRLWLFLNSFWCFDYSEYRKNVILIVAKIRCTFFEREWSVIRHVNNLGYDCKIEDTTSLFCLSGCLFDLFLTIWNSWLIIIRIQSTIQALVR